MEERQSKRTRKEQCIHNAQQKSAKKIADVFAVINCLEAGEKITKSQLAERANVSRTFLNNNDEIIRALDSRQADAAPVSDTPRSQTNTTQTTAPSTTDAPGSLVLRQRLQASAAEIKQLRKELNLVYGHLAERTGFTDEAWHQKLHDLTQACQSST